jgi:two-component system, cell cycle sensor histidine kinase and response regulator CckA
VFCIELPGLDASAPAPQKEMEISRESTPSPTGTETVLVVEDDESVRQLLRELLTGYGYAVVTAATGQEALHRSTQYTGKIHMLLTDVVMPGMNGRQLAEKLRGQHAGLKVLYMSGYAEDGALRHGIEQAAEAFIAKPYELDTLLRKVREVLDEG